MSIKNNCLYTYLDFMISETTFKKSRFSLTYDFINIFILSFDLYCSYIQLLFNYLLLKNNKFIHFQTFYSSWIGSCKNVKRDSTQ